VAVAKRDVSTECGDTRIAGAMGMHRYLVSVMVLALGCSKSEPPAPTSETSAPATGSPAAAQEAREVFTTLCSTCHGQGGKGDGAAAASLDPKPRNYTDKAWQASITDEQIAKTIVQGGAAMGKSQLMPPSPQLANKPDVVAELVKIVRGFGQ
jgi:cytochrome c553